jgi:CheY-specific phosphatase CheX
LETPITDLQEPFVTAVRLTLGEMAADYIDVRAAERHSGPRTLGDINAAVELRTGLEATLVLSFSQQTATAIARQIMKDSAHEITAALAADCMGEIANIVAGQAKTILAEGPNHFVFSTPVISSEVATRDAETLAIQFDSTLGDFALQLCLRRN